MSHQLDTRALSYALVAVLILVAAIYFGSGELRDFDPALTIYTSAVVFATFGIVYRYAVWLQRPPTLVYWKRGWSLFLQPARLPANLLMLLKLLWRNFVLQTFIEQRSHLRWIAHFLISWGCITAAAVTFPLVFGWIHFEADPRRPDAYQAVAFGIHAAAFPAESLMGWITFHILDFSAIAVLIGITLSFRRRMYDRGAMSVQQFANDFLPLILLVSICVTGLMLTVSSLWLRGVSYSFLSILHAFTVIVTLLYLPFGKFFHIFQRPAQLGIQYYKHEGADISQAICHCCGTPYASRMHVEDLKTILNRLEIDQTMADGTHYQDTCPSCRRRLLAVNQLAAIGGPGFL